MGDNLNLGEFLLPSRAHPLLLSTFARVYSQISIPSFLSPPFPPLSLSFLVNGTDLGEQLIAFSMSSLSPSSRLPSSSLTSFPLQVLHLLDPFTQEQVHPTEADRSCSRHRMERRLWKTMVNAHS